MLRNGYRVNKCSGCPDIDIKITNNMKLKRGVLMYTKKFKCFVCGEVQRAKGKSLW